MMIFTHLFRFFLVFTLINLCSCHYYPDLRGETAGSAGAGLITGLAVAEAGGDLITMGFSTIAMSALGGMLGEEFIDSRTPLMLEDPIADPIPLFYYRTLRPIMKVKPFFPGIILIPPTRV